MSTVTREGSLFVSLAEGGARLGMADSTVRDQIKAGTYPFGLDQHPYMVRRVGGRLRMSLKVIDAYANGEVGPRPVDESEAS